MREIIETMLDEKFDAILAAVASGVAGSVAVAKAVYRETWQSFAALGTEISVSDGKHFVTNW